MPRRAQVVFLALCCLALALPGFAQVYQAPETDETKPTKRAVPERASGAGMLVAIDPVTGELRPPTPAEAAALTAPKPGAAPTRASRLIRTASGMDLLLLDEAAFDYFTVRIGDDGKLHTACVQHDVVDSILRLPVQTPKLEEK